MGAAALLRMALSPAAAFAAYWAVRPLSPSIALAVGAVIMLALALLPGTGRGEAAFAQG